jgi:hypothetical protein
LRHEIGRFRVILDLSNPAKTRGVGLSLRLPERPAPKKKIQQNEAAKKKNLAECGVGLSLRLPERPAKKKKH